MLLPSDPSFRVTVRDLTKSYGDSLVLDHVSLDLESGCPCCLMAPSGAGKTTLFRILMGLETADSGTIEGLEGRSFSAVFQEDRLLEGYTALQNIRFVTGRWYPAHELTAIIKHLLPEDSLKKPVSEFSGGMKRRTAILRAILAPADIVLMDEPFTGLDQENRARALAAIRETAGVRPVLLVTHDTELAAECADVCGMLFNGEILNEAAPEEMFRENYFYTTPMARLVRGISKNG